MNSSKNDTTRTTKLESPEQLDRLVTVISPRTWLVIAGAAIILAAFLAWAFFGSVSITETAEGIVLNEDNGEIVTFVAADAPVAVSVDDPASVRVTMGEHTGTGFYATVTDIDGMARSREGVGEILPDAGLSGYLVPDEPVILVTLSPNGEQHLTVGELVEAQITVSQMHPYQYLFVN